MFDAALLVAAVLIGFLGSRARLAPVLADLSLSGAEDPLILEVYDAARPLAFGMVASTKPILLALTMTLPILRLRHPRSTSASLFGNRVCPLVQQS